MSNEFRKRIKKRQGVHPSTCYRTTYKLNKHLNYKYRVKHIRSDQGNTVGLDLRDEADLFFDKFPIFRQFYRSSESKKDFLKLLVGFRGLYGVKGVEIPQSVVCEALGVSQNAVSMYIKQLIDLGVIKKISNSYKVGSFSKRYICINSDLHTIHVKVVHPDPDKKMKRKIKTKARLLKLVPLRQKAWEEFESLMKDCLMKRKAWVKLDDLETVTVTGSFIAPFYPDRLPTSDVIKQNLNTPILFTTHDNKNIDISKVSKLFSIKQFGCDQETYDFLHPAGSSIVRTTGKLDFYEVLSKIGKIVTLYKFYERDLLRDINSRALLLKSFDILYRYCNKKKEHKSMFGIFLSFYRRIMRKSELYSPKRLNLKRIRSGIIDLNIAVEYFNFSYAKELVSKTKWAAITHRIKNNLKNIIKIYRINPDTSPPLSNLCSV